MASQGNKNWEKLGFTGIDGELKMPGMSLPVRALIVPAMEGKVLFSPDPGTDWRGVSGITDIVAPNLFHHLGVAEAAKAFPAARVWAPDGMRQKVPSVHWSHTLHLDPWPHKEIVPIRLRGMPKVQESVFYVPAAKTLLVTDLGFHLVGRKGIGAWLVLHLFGTWNKFGISRFFLSFVKDKGEFTESLKEIFLLDFENLIMSHGEPIWGNAKSRLAAALGERGWNV